MTLADDDRARVPFALVGVVLLVSSAVYATGLAATDPLRDRTPAERALAATQTATHAALQRAAVNASAQAAAAPLTAPANTSYGRVLRGDAPFERYLRLLVYQRARAAFATTSSRAGAVVATPVLPAIDSPAAARAAIARTTLSRVANGTRMRVTVRNVTYVVARDDRRVATHRENLSVVAGTPVLALHDRTRRFQRRLDADPLAGPGLGRRLTARAWLVAQTRGLAQHGGAPIANVVPNRHLELQTNGAAVALQRDAFGRADPDSRRALTVATAEVGLRDVAAGAAVARTRWSERVLQRNHGVTAPTAGALATPPPLTGRTASVGVNETADDALAGLLGGDRLRTVVADAYSADARLVTAVRTESATENTAGSRPDGGVLVSTDATTTRETSRVEGATVPPDVAGDERLAASFARRVVTERRTVRVYRALNRTTRVVTTRRTTRLVRVGVAVSPRTGAAPDRPVALTPTSTRLDTAAVDRLVTDRGGRRAVAGDAAAGTLDETPVTVRVAPPPAAVRAARRAVVATHERVRTHAQSIAAGAGVRERGPRALAASLRESRPALVDAPPRYRSRRHVARTAARAAYVDGVLSRLDAESTDVAATASALDDYLAARGVDTPPRDAPAVPAPGDHGITVDATPAYLPLTEVTPRTARVDSASHLLAARNVNLFAVPYGDAADAVAGAVVPDPPATVDPAVAARTLVASNGTGVPANDTLADRRRHLETRLELSNRVFAGAMRDGLRAHTSLSNGARNRLVRESLAAWRTPARRTLATLNGSVPDRVAARAAARSDADRVVLAALLRAAVREARQADAARVPRGRVEKTANATRAVLDTAVRRTVAAGTQEAAARARHRVLAKKLAALPAGLPVAPVPGSWYATVNVWVLDVRGAYHRVAVRSRVAAPTRPDGVTYVREAARVAHDVDGDGDLERLGRVDPVAFDVQTAVVVAVPPGPRGVGDVDGDLDERSPGWPGPPAATARNVTQAKPPSTGSA